MGWKLTQSLIFGVPIFVTALTLIVLGVRLVQGFDDGPFGDASRIVAGGIATLCGFFYPLAFGFIDAARTEGDGRAEAVVLTLIISGAGLVLGLLLAIFVGTRNLRSARTVPKIAFSPGKLKMYRERQSPVRFAIMGSFLILGAILNLTYLHIVAV